MPTNQNIFIRHALRAKSSEAAFGFASTNKIPLNFPFQCGRVRVRVIPLCSKD